MTCSASLSAMIRVFLRHIKPGFKLGSDCHLCVSLSQIFVPMRNIFGQPHVQNVAIILFFVSGVGSE
jgi:hypothetical protein